MSSPAVTANFVHFRRVCCSRLFLCFFFFVVSPRLACRTVYPASTLYGWGTSQSYCHRKGQVSKKAPIIQKKPFLRTGIELNFRVQNTRQISLYTETLFSGKGSPSAGGRIKLFFLRAKAKRGGLQSSDSISLQLNSFLDSEAGGWGKESPFLSPSLLNGSAGIVSNFANAGAFLQISGRRMRKSGQLESLGRPALIYRKR